NLVTDVVAVPLEGHDCSGRRHIETFADRVRIDRVALDGGQPCSFGGPVSDIEVLGEEPPDLDDSAEEKDQEGHEERELDDARANVVESATIASSGITQPHPPSPVEFIRTDPR